MNQPDVLPIRSGAYLIHKSTAPRARHETFSAAEAEAIRLLGANPGATFIISREEARVRLHRSASGIPLTRRKS
ncbi:hypothetical protein [Sphingomonas sp. ACRSK]|uniref:hypothetical protein n=1 Tax=Sphingomonas sp. ACRSK TaxID=2918213 RepID=UPI001EF6F460|nr:hypothetical protein [Sphingomonas sp. ACRSK]MCG7346605.1 hypothetical protein [Sphingomonas sp. ACRSK]